MWKKLTKIFNAKELEDEVEETGTSSIKDKIQGILLAVFYIGGIMLFIFLVVDKMKSIETIEIPELLKQRGAEIRTPSIL